MGNERFRRQVAGWLRCVVFVAGLAALSSCAEGFAGSLSTTDGNDELSLTTNLQIPSFSAPHGLDFLSPFDESKPTIIYVHGTLFDKEFLHNFPNVEGWVKAGFNAVAYRWHKAAFDDKVCVNFFGLTKSIRCAYRSEKDVWGNGVWAGEEFVRHYEDFFAARPDYHHEVRVVGASLGAQMATYLTYRLWEKDWQLGARPTRLELLDLFAGGKMVNGLPRIPADAVFPVPADQPAPSPACGEGNRYTQYCVLENALYLLKELGVAIVDYGSNVQGMSAWDLRLFLNYQSFDAGYLCPKSWWNNKAECGSGNLLRDPYVLEAQHVFPLFAYMWSISEDRMPVNGFTARTPTEALVHTQRWIKQKPNDQYCNLPKGKTLEALEYLAEGKFRLPQTWPLGSFDALRGSLMTELGMSASMASQCAAAVSFSNDVYSD